MPFCFQVCLIQFIKIITLSDQALQTATTHNQQMENKQQSASHLRTGEPEANLDKSHQGLNQGKAKEEDQEDGVGFSELFRFADSYDCLMMTIGTIGGLALGASTPIFILFWGQFTDVFDSTIDVLVDQAKEQLLKFIYLGIGTLIMGWAMITCWLITGERQAVACRKAYFACLLKQEIGWFDCIDQSSLSSSFSSDTLTYQGALGEKMAMMIQAVGTGIGGLTVAFTQGWLMSLVCLAGIPLIGFSGFIYMKALQLKSKQYQRIYSRAGGQAEQAFYSIKTVKQLNGEQYEHRTFLDLLSGMEVESLQAGMKVAAGFGMISGSMFIIYSLGYWFGSNCVEGNSHCSPDMSHQTYTAGNVVTIFFSILVSCFYLSQLSPALKKIGQGKDAAQRIYKMIDREPIIKNPENGLKLDNFSGRIRLENVTFAYPKDPKKTILDNISIEFDINNTALVGESGCGKSTILQLIMRFYDPQQGRILFDGHDIRDLDLVWLRNIIGYVGQEPVLFATSIKENLLLGNENSTDQEIDEALKKAEAYDFVYELQNKLDTYVGAGGGQISGGQKQRLAIARALLKNPKILLLDEATSALDRKNQKLIQHTLNKVSQGLTTVTVAHRVRTIMSADIIYVIDRGTIKQKGHFRELSRYKDYEDNQKKEQKQEEKEFKPMMVVEQEMKGNGLIGERERERKEQFAEIDEKKKREAEQNKALIAKHEQKIFRRIFSYLDKHWISFILGIIFTLLLGLVYPVFSLFLGQIINALFSLSSHNPAIREKGRQDANLASLVFLILGIGIFLVTLIRDLLTHFVGNEITNNIRSEAYRKILRMPIYWFDRADNNCGVLSTRLGTDCQTINGMATTYIYIIIQCLSTLTAGIVIAVIYEWRITLVALGSMPLIMLSGAVRSKFRNGLMEQTDKAYKDSAQIIMESLTNIRTVVSFGVQNTVMHKYQRYIDKPQEDLQVNSAISGFFFGLSQVVNFIVFGLLFFIGTLFMRSYGVSLLDVFVAVYEIFFAGITIGNNSSFLPDINEAKLSASHIFQILDEEDEHQLQEREQSKMITSGIKGHIKLDRVSFKYESRQQWVFRHMNIEIKPGQKIAFVGPSGCGKSTIVQLLQRFYFPQEGTITLDGVDLKDYDIHYLRSQFGVVSQEPVLFNASFRENIKYNRIQTSEEEIRHAAEQSNALSFIQGKQKIAIEHETDPQAPQQGFDRSVGLKGSHISGGQKQRVAIARAILRNPQILLLDEATSALDSENEKKVQDSLDRIMASKTTLSIAHRIETIQNSDLINVFEKGEIVESGTYQQLLAKRGFFFNLKQGTQFV